MAEEFHSSTGIRTKPTEDGRIDACTAVKKSRQAAADATQHKRSRGCPSIRVDGGEAGWALVVVVIVLAALRLRQFQNMVVNAAGLKIESEETPSDPQAISQVSAMPSEQLTRRWKNMGKRSLLTGDDKMRIGRWRKTTEQLGSSSKEQTAQMRVEVTANSSHIQVKKLINRLVSKSRL
ncbi:unnamed protein product [Strongylus vulgaris]|uniref:Uncharacterized protein n=1 Tax=Strongylus vulgaris TaxID=40348 RepID=A0A3P7I1I0_STRVU|nr:unnamed protein product [Strongylus vulgaris]